MLTGSYWNIVLITNLTKCEARGPPRQNLQALISCRQRTEKAEDPNYLITKSGREDRILNFASLSLQDKTPGCDLGGVVHYTNDLMNKVFFNYSKL